MQEYKIVFTGSAKDDLINIGDYITYILHEPEIAYNFIKKLRKAIYSLKVFPERYELIKVHVIGGQDVRCMPYKSYYVFYEIIEVDNTVVVLRVGYNRRNWNDILKK